MHKANRIKRKFREQKIVFRSWEYCCPNKNSIEKLETYSRKYPRKREQKNSSRKYVNAAVFSVS